MDGKWIDGWARARARTRAKEWAGVLQLDSPAGIIVVLLAITIRVDDAIRTEVQTTRTELHYPAKDEEDWAGEVERRR